MRTQTLPAVAQEFARYYDTARTAHLERLAHMVPADFLYTRTRADWDEDLARKLPQVERLAIGNVMRRIWTRRYALVEIPEPLAVRLIPQLTLIAFVVRVRNFLSPQTPTRLVTYAIENLDPISKFSIQTHLPHWLARGTLRLFWRLIFADVSKIAFGTQGAREAYVSALGRRWERVVASTDIQIFPAVPASTAEPPSKTSYTVCFLGTFEVRKGIFQLMKSWDAVVSQQPNAKLTILGKGDHEREVVRFAETRPSVELHIDPPRATIREALASSVLLVLLSQRTPLWREQVGLPILEALEQGCEIVTTAETGIADWLASNGHSVVIDANDETEVAQQILRRINSPRPASDLLAMLPLTDGRYSADTWMFSRTE